MKYVRGYFVPFLLLLYMYTVYSKKYAHGFCFAVLCCGYTLTDFPISIRLTSLALWQSNDCPSASKATLMNMDKHFMLIHYERLHSHNKTKHNKTVCIFLGIYCNFILIHEVRLSRFFRVVSLALGQSRYYPTVYPKKYAHGFVVLCFVVVIQSFILNSHEVFIHIHQGCFAGIGAIVRLPQCQWSKPDGYGKISQCITTTKHSKAVTVCIFLGINCSAGKTTMQGIDHYLATTKLPEPNLVDIFCATVCFVWGETIFKNFRLTCCTLARWLSDTCVLHYGPWILPSLKFICK